MLLCSPRHTRGYLCPFRGHSRARPLGEGSGSIAPMEARRRSATGGGVIGAIAAGAAGGVYLWKEIAATDTDAAHHDGGLAGDASADARAGRGKPKLARRSARPRKPGTGAHPSNGGHGGAGGSGGNEGQDEE